MHPHHPDFALPEVDRRAITQEEPPRGSWYDPHNQDVDWIGPDNQGGGYVPPDFEWRSNPKQEQEQDSCG